MYTNEQATYFSYITMDGIVGGYSVWLNPFHWCRYLMEFYHGKVEVVGKSWSPHVIIMLVLSNVSIGLLHYCKVYNNIDSNYSLRRVYYPDDG